MGTPRSIELMVKARREIQRKLPDLLPSGPWLSDEAALVDIRAWAENPKLGGGGWGVSWGSGKRAGTKDRGQQHVVVCHQHKRNCGWRLTLEHCVEGWAVFFVTEHEHYTPHNHALTQNTAEAMAFPAMRSIPEELLPIARDLKDSGAKVKDVYSFLQHTVRKEGKEPLFNYDNVYYAVGASTQERALDATNFVAWLREREKATGLPYEHTEDADGCLDKAFWPMEGAAEIYAQDPEHMQVLYDVKASALMRPDF